MKTAAGCGQAGPAAAGLPGGLRAHPVCVQGEMVRRISWRGSDSRRPSLGAALLRMSRHP